jgi:hypothetical protein
MSMSETTFQIIINLASVWVLVKLLRIDITTTTIGMIAGVIIGSYIFK